jgi:hypothetical protein
MSDYQRGGKMKNIAIVLGLTCVGLTACDISHPVAVVGPANIVYRGTATSTFIEGGWFQVSNGANSCSGRFQPIAESNEVTFPVRCTNGLTGVGTATYQNPRAGGGEITMRDGTMWKFIFGQGALLV